MNGNVMVTTERDGADSDQRGSSDHTRALVLIAVAGLAIGVFLRLFRLDFKGLWLDEIFTAQQSYEVANLADLFNAALLLDPHPPLYKFLIVGWSNLFGYSDFAIRLPSALFGIAAIVAFYFVLRSVFRSSIATNGTVLLAFSWPALYYAQEARSYSLLLLFAVLSTGVWLRILTLPHEDRLRGPIRWLIVLSVITASVHLYGFILVGYLWTYLLAAAWLARDKVLVRRAAIGLAITVGSFVPWLGLTAAAMADAGRFAAMAWMSSPDAAFFVDVGAYFYHHPIPALLLGVGPVALGAVYAGRRVVVAAGSRDLRDPLVALICLIVLPFAAVFVFSQFRPMLQTRFLMAFLPAVLIFVAVVYDNWRWRSAWQRSAILLALAGASLLWVLPDYYKVRAKPQTREAVQYVQSNLEENSAIMAPCLPEFFEFCDPAEGRLALYTARYVHYLNYDQLPQISFLPSIFTTTDEAAAFAAGFREQQITKVFVVASSGHLHMLAVAVQELTAAGYECLEIKFIMSAVEECRLGVDGGG